VCVCVASTEIIMDWKCNGSYRSWPILWYNPSILEALRTITDTRRGCQ